MSDRSFPTPEPTFCTAEEVASAAQREGARVYENAHTNQFEPWPISRIEACVARLRAEPGGDRDEELQNFCRFHPNGLPSTPSSRASPASSTP